MLLAKVWDKINAGIRKNIPAHTGFLSPRELELCRYLFGSVSGLTEFGGYDGAERRMLVYLPEYLESSDLWEEESPVVCLRGSFPRSEKPSHRDFLGALMGAGIRREAVGDICVGADSCDFFVTAEIAPYILQNLTSVGRIRLHLQAVDLNQARIPEPEVQILRDTLASLRLDSVVAAGFRIGRSAAVQAITQGRVAIDGLPCEKPDKTVPEGARLSLRGMGKISLAAVNGRTRKDRISVIIHRYV